jgi:hypothetical protein
MNISNEISNYSETPEAGCRVIYGPHAASAYLLSICAEIAVQRPLRVLDFGNRCDMYFAARQLRMMTNDPVKAMRNIRLQRAFTCYQALSLLRQLEDPEPDMPVIILDLLAPFLDENIQPREIDRLFRASVEQIRNAMQTRPLLIGVKPIPQRLELTRMGLLKWLTSEFGMLRLSESGNVELPEPDTAQPSLF